MTKAEKENIINTAKKTYRYAIIDFQEAVGREYINGRDIEYCADYERGRISGMYTLFTNMMKAMGMTYNEAERILDEIQNELDPE